MLYMYMNNMKQNLNYLQSLLCAKTLIILSLTSPIVIADSPSDSVFLREETILSGYGDLTADIGIFYQRDTGVRNGNLVKRDTFQSIQALRYGFNQRVELSVSFPYKYVSNHLSLNSVSVGRESNSGLGDISVSTKYQLAFERNSTPDLVLSLTVDGDNGDIGTATEPGIGSGLWEYNLAILVAKSIDPVIYFTKIGYRYTAPSTINQVKNKPGDSFEYRFGTGYAMNDRVTLSFQLVGLVQQKGRVGTTQVAATHQASFQIGNTISFGKSFFIEPVISFGLTPESADFLFGVSFPVDL